MDVNALDQNRKGTQDTFRVSEHLVSPITVFFFYLFILTIVFFFLPLIFFSSVFVVVLGTHNP